MSTITGTTPDVSTLVNGIEQRDSAAVAAWYTDDATFTSVDRDHPPSDPQVLRGAAAITEQLTEVCARDMTHEVRDLVVTSDALAFTEYCTYPDGTKVLCATIASLRDGKISRQIALQAWDG
ncbi:nuclear transport factor 2 family protein [Angustibacter sp. McL0619]|uniref:nuclear transport factor 2 family protein n=1 Tax=Angustibacter sp. McL0619 TaxID=3415676 RepID=UPI003CF31395